MADRGNNPQPGGLTSDDLQTLASLGIDVSALGASPAPQQSQSDLAAAVLAAAQGTAPYAGNLPWWAQGMQDSLVGQGSYGDVYSNDEGLVYLGHGKQRTPSTAGQPPNKYATDLAPDSVGSGPDKVSKKDYALTVTQATNLPYSWDEKEIADAIKRLRSAGMQVNTFDDLVSAWGGLVNRAALTYATSDNKRKVTPWDVLDMYKSEQQAAGTWVDPNRTETRVSKSVNDITEGQAWASLQGTLSQMLGRDPSDQETRDFTYKMGKLAASNPTISKTVTQYKNGDAVSSSTDTSGGFTADDVAQQAYDQAQAQPDYAEYRSASYYMNALMGALGPMGG